MQNSKTFGECVTCHRHTALTKHHLIPKKQHKKKDAKHSTLLNEVIFVCRMCHDGIHNFYNEQTLSKEFNTLQKLLDDPTLKKHFLWVGKNKKGMRS
jgi:predicted ATP-dependent serine protease